MNHQALRDAQRRHRSHSPTTRWILRVLLVIAITWTTMLLVLPFIARADEPPATISTDGVPPHSSITLDGVPIVTQSGKVETTIDGIDMVCWPIDREWGNYDRFATSGTQLYGCDTVDHQAWAPYMAFCLLIAIPAIFFGLMILLAKPDQPSSADTEDSKDKYVSDPFVGF